MSEARTADVVRFPFHSVAQYDSPDDVLHDRKLSVAEKRVILSSWASDLYAVESKPALREVPGVSHSLQLTDILAALRQLDEDTDPPPRGGIAMRVWRPSSLEVIAPTAIADRRRLAWRRSWVATRSRRLSWR